MAHRHMKRCSMPLIIRQRQIKTKMRHHLTSVRMATIFKSINNQGWWECGERGTLVHYWWGCRLVQPLWKAVWRYLKKLKMDLPFDPAIPLLGIFPKEPKTLIQKHPYLHCSIIYNSQDLEAVQVSISKWVDKTAMVHLPNGMLLRCEKGNLTLVTAWMDLENIILSEISQSEKDK